MKGNINSMAPLFLPKKSMSTPVIPVPNMAPREGKLPTKDDSNSDIGSVNNVVVLSV